MKTCLRLICVSILWLTCTQVANSQVVLSDGGPGGPGGSQVGGFQPVRGDLNVGLPGRIWFGSNYADQGLGYSGSFLTLGAKTRLFEDPLDGRWLGEARAHYGLEEGGFFGNLGIERVISIRSAGADVSVGGWVDYDGDEQGSFAHSFTQVGLSAAIKTRRWDLIGNGYFPVGTTDYSQSGPAGEECFYHNYIVMSPGTDSALKGFDATLRFRPQMLGMVNGTVDVGGYGYGSELVEYFGGGRIRVGAQLLNGLMFSTEVNHDDRFDTTVAVGMSWIYGVNARGTAYGGLGRDLESTVRNEHIVRFQREVVLAINPDTGVAYNVIHVDNTADDSVADGTRETPFRRLADAESASAANDMIFVHAGNGTAQFQDAGIVLKDGQYFLGSGVDHFIPVQGGLNFQLCNPIGTRPVISASGRGNAITLANNNTVRGFIIDGTAGVGGMANGIFGDGFSSGIPLNNGIIENTTITGAILNGVHLNGIEGNWTFANNNFDENGVDGVLIENACDPASQFVFEGNTFNGNGNDGLHLVNYDAESLILTDNETNDNGRDGLRLENFKNAAGNGLVLDLLGHDSTQNSHFGVHIVGGDGDLRVINGQIFGNNGGGLRIVDWTNTDPTTMVFVGAGDINGVSNYSNNPGGIGLDIELNAGSQRLLVMDTTADGNEHGLRLTTRGINTILDANIFDNASFSGNAGDGIRMVSRGGATQRVVIAQPTLGGQLQIANNAQSGINLLAGVNDLGVTSVIDLSITDTLITGNAAGMRAVSNGDGQIIFLAQNMDWTFNQVHADIEVQNNTTSLVNMFRYHEVTMDNTTPLLLGAGDAFRVRNFGDSMLDLVVTDSVITNTLSDYNPPGGGGTIFVDTNSSIGEGQGFDIRLGGTDSLTRFVLRGTEVSNFNYGAMTIAATNESQLLMDWTGNDIRFNGFGPGDSPILDGTVNQVPGTETPGIVLAVSGDAVVNYEARNNFISNNYGTNMVQTATGNATINAVWIENDFSVSFLGQDVNMSNVGFNATTCLSMGSNLFNNGQVAFTNSGGAANFTLELDGITNGIAFDFSNPQIVGPRTPAPFGTVCEPAVDANKAAFDALGFPPITH